jgi:two-component system sensor kinase FixL
VISGFHGTWSQSLSSENAAVAEPNLIRNSELPATATATATATAAATAAAIASRRPGFVRRLLSASRGRSGRSTAKSWTDPVPGLLDDGIVGIVAEGAIAYWSRGAEAMFGYAAAEMIGRKLAVLAGAPATDLAALVLQSDRQGGMVATLRRRDGALLTAMLACAPVRDARHRRFGTSILVRDITEARRIAAELHALQLDQAALQQQAAALSRLTAVEQVSGTLAHELNQPLAAIVNYARAGQQLLASHPSPDLPKLAQALDRMLSQSLRAGQIIARLRAFIARGEADKRVESVAALIDEAVRLALPDADHRAVHLTIDLDPAARLVLADRIQVQQVLLNLIRNAVQAMQGMPATARRALTIASRLAGGMVAISVTDTGPGIAEEIGDRLFEPFVTTRQDGTGLGLTICHAIVQAHGGALTWEPAPHGGTIFRFTLTGIAEAPA